MLLYYFFGVNTHNMLLFMPLIRIHPLTCRCFHIHAPWYIREGSGLDKYFVKDFIEARFGYITTTL